MFDFEFQKSWRSGKKLTWWMRKILLWTQPKFKAAIQGNNFIPIVETVRCQLDGLVFRLGVSLNMILVDQLAKNKKKLFKWWKWFCQAILRMLLTNEIQSVTVQQLSIQMLKTWASFILEGWIYRCEDENLTTNSHFDKLIFQPPKMKVI